MQSIEQIYFENSPSVGSLFMIVGTLPGPLSTTLGPGSLRSYLMVYFVSATCRGYLRGPKRDSRLGVT